MKKRSLKEQILPPGPIMTLMLIGLMLLSGVLYYRAIKIQRFLEPALAFSQPRNEFAQDINQLLLKEFGSEALTNVRFTMGSIEIEESLLFDNNNVVKPSAYKTLRKLNHVFVSALNEFKVRSRIDLILVGVRYPIGPSKAMNNKLRFRMQHRAEVILDLMYKIEPELEKDYGVYFVASALPMNPLAKGTNIVEFRIVPSELLHIEVLQRLQKYVQ